MKPGFLAACLGLILGNDHYLNRPRHSAFQINPNPQPFEALPDAVREVKNERDKRAKRKKARGKKKRGY